MPTITVIIPTFKRPELLKRAVASVLSQSYADWDLVISDDEDPPGETWAYLQTLAASDPRVTVTRNPGPHGQTGNVNNALIAARGEWVKPLFDDDVLLPNCLETFASAAAKAPRAALVSCGVHRYRDGKRFRTSPPPGLPRLQIVEQPYVLLGMYLQDRVGGGMPTQVMVRRTAITGGAIFRDHPALVSAVDSYWLAHVAAHGDSVIINEPLIEEHQGAHQTVTSSVSSAKLDAEGEVLRGLQFAMIDPAMCPPSLQVSRQTLRLIRAAHRLSQRAPGQAVKLAAGAWHPRAWILAVRWILRQRFPGKFNEVPRRVLA